MSEGIDLDTLTPLERACYRYLADKPFSLWGQYSISDDERRKLAAIWFATNIEGLAAWLVGEAHFGLADAISYIQAQG